MNSLWPDHASENREPISVAALRRMLQTNAKLHLEFGTRRTGDPLEPKTLTVVKTQTKEIIFSGPPFNGQGVLPLPVRGKHDNQASWYMTTDQRLEFENPNAFFRYRLEP